MLEAAGIKLSYYIIFIAGSCDLCKNSSSARVSNGTKNRKLELASSSIHDGSGEHDYMRPGLMSYCHRAVYPRRA